MRGTGSPVRVLHSFVLRDVRTPPNPFMSLLLGSMPGSVEPIPFTWRTAVLGRYDVFHVHWPEALCVDDRPVHGVVKKALTLLLLVRLRILGVPVVRTMHNLAPHEAPDRLSGLLVRAVERRAAARIFLNDDTGRWPSDAGALIRHGDYRRWFAAADVRTRPESGRLLFFGKIRAYKNVDGLVAAFVEMADDACSLRVVGEPSSPDLARAIAVHAGSGQHVSLRFGHLPDDELAAEVLRSQLVVLPYHDMYNSGAMLLALSLNRPVLVPENRVTRDMAAEVGGRWVITYRGPLTARTLRDAVLRAGDARGRVRFTGRDWDDIGRQHAELYTAVAGCRA